MLCAVCVCFYPMMPSKTLKSVPLPPFHTLAVNSPPPVPPNIPPSVTPAAIERNTRLGRKQLILQTSCAHLTPAT